MNEQGAATVAGWRRTVESSWQSVAGAGTPDLAAARAAFFGPAPPGAQRQILQTDAVVPGGQDGIIVNRMYIADKLAAFGQLFGDDRGPSLDPNASSRFDIAWDTRTGQVSVTVHPSTIVPNSPFNPDTVIGKGPAKAWRMDAWPINVGPDSLDTPFRNNFIVNTGPGRVDVKYDVINSGLPDPARWGAVQGDASVSVSGDGISGSMHGEDYPDREVIQYRDDGARQLFTRPMAPNKETEIFGQDYDTPNGDWRVGR